MASPSLALMGASRLMQVGSGIAKAYQQKIFAQLQADAIGNAISEIENRASIDSRNRFERGDVVAAEQMSAYTSGGVELEGSAMDVISDTLSDAAESAFIRQKEATYEMVRLSGDKALLEEQASRTNFILNSLAAGLGGAGGFAGDYASYRRGGTGDVKSADGLFVGGENA